jgi:UDP-N-acetylglucosamine transferase subunit ALG13
MAVMFLFALGKELVISSTSYSEELDNFQIQMASKFQNINCSI